MTDTTTEVGTTEVDTLKANIASLNKTLQRYKTVQNEYANLVRDRDIEIERLEKELANALQNTWPYKVLQVKEYLTNAINRWFGKIVTLTSPKEKRYAAEMKNAQTIREIELVLVKYGKGVTK